MSDEDHSDELKRTNYLCPECLSRFWVVECTYTSGAPPKEYHFAYLKCADCGHTTGDVDIDDE